jgi:2,3-dihydroxybiphenyl 1,2-dioxygenase
MVAIAQLGYLGLSVANLEAWERFATEVLGLEISRREPDGSLALRMDENDWRIALHPTGADDVAYLGWEVPDEDTLLALADLLKASGVAVREGGAELAKARRVRGLVEFSDPSGVASEIYFGPLVRHEKPFRSPRAHAGFRTGEQGLGHVVLMVRDFEATFRFYHDLLGFRVSDYVELQPAPNFRVTICFLHANPRHHSLAFVAAPAAKRLNHFMLETATLDDVGRTLDLCPEHGVAIAQTLGRHTNDHMVSFYAVTPSGFQVEVGWGARQVDDRTWQVQTHESGSAWGHRRP